MKIDKNKKYETRDGRAVRIYAIDGNEVYPVHGAYKGKEDGEWYAETWTSAGFMSSRGSGAFDLVEVEATKHIKQKIWVNVYKGGSGSYPHNSKNRAIEASDFSVFGRKEIELDFTIEEGEGL